jgi:hypothetical protein
LRPSRERWSKCQSLPTRPALPLLLALLLLLLLLALPLLAGAGAGRTTPRR